MPLFHSSEGPAARVAVRLPRLWRTMAFRLSVLYAGLFVVFTGLLLLFVYRSTAGFIQNEMSDTVAIEVAGLEDQYARHGLAGLLEVVRQRSSLQYTNSLYLVRAPNGVILAGNLSAWPDVPPDENGWAHFQVASSAGPSNRPSTASAMMFTLPGNAQLLVGRDTSEIDTLRRRIWQSLGWVVTGAVVLGLIGGGLISHGAMRQIDAINRTTRRIMGGDLTGRVKRSGSGDEIDTLAANLNTMLDQIERLMTGIRQVTDSIAHDLRTPLTRLRSRIELVLIREDADPEVYRTALQETIVEADRLLDTFKALLSIAEAESGSRGRNFQPVNLAEVARMAADLYEPVADDKGLELHADIRGEPVLSGNPQLLSQALANLLDNAIKYTPAGSVTLTVEAGTGGRGPRVTVADTGPGIPPEMRDKVLERFVRLDDARASPGNGLGLSLVDAVARLHGAALELDGNEPGLRITLQFPKA
ncbi:signal transduction histidine kinase [Azospirillum fermentarium]|uniref:sensor histidine kinase n=1 Tax=Azospirillum fermentarium TaxID=1233114 RepID=UPI002225FCF2|nr:HAMP domain-containing sensor histidine kinase [Azospirillum fermentarium]MCW2245903.1 signal transduction histidine kinase [Azospirillum fermentarium]